MPLASDAAHARCPSCGFESPASFRFCGHCGGKLGESSPPGAAEHRQVTVVFCDLVESTALAERLDPEELREVVCEYQSVAAAEVERYAGHVAQYLGDGLLVYFGYPQAQEDDARRAVHTAQGIVDAVERLNRELESVRGLRLGVRMGIHTGPVVAGEVGGGSHREHLALGTAPNVAARLQALAEPGSVLLSAATARLVDGFFDCESLGQQRLKGISQPLEVYRLVGASGVQGRFELAVQRGLVPFVGRQRELALMLERLELAAIGRGQVVQVVGEAGIGKSRLVYELRQRAAATWRVCRCSPYHTTSALYPIVELGRELFRLASEDPPDDVLARLERRLGSLGFALETALPLLADLLSLPVPAGYPRLELGPKRKKVETFELLIALLVRLAHERTVVLCVEDLHWIDPSSLELVELLVARASAARLFVLLTTRPSFVAPWAPPPHQTVLDFDRLSEAEARAMIAHVAGGEALPGTIVRQLVRQADGVPLFVEELTRAVIESDPGAETAIPSTLRDSLTARLDRLGPAKGLAQLGAVIGREFSFPMLSAVAGLGEIELCDQLARLLDAELCYQRGTPPQSSYVFKHALIRDAAYESLLRSQRALYHRQIADAIVERFPAVSDAEPELLARHLTLAGLDERAAGAWLRAGQMAYERGANQEALDHLGQGLAALERLPADPARSRRELALRSLCGLVHIATHGHASPQVESAFGRALELCTELGESASPFWLKRGLWTFYLTRGKFDRAYEIAQGLLGHPQTRDDLAARLEASYAAGATLFGSGRLGRAREYLERALEMEPEVQDHGHRHLASGVDPGVTTLSALALVLWLQGFPERALVSSRRAYELARSIPHAFSECFSLNYAVWLHLLRRDAAQADRASELELAIATDSGYVLFERAARVQGTGAAVLEFGREATLADAEEGLAWRERFLQLLAGVQATGLRLFVPLILAVAVDAFVRRRLRDVAGSLLEEAFSVLGLTGERAWEAELHRLRGELERDREPQAAADAFGEALAVARRQGALSFELRAATSLADLLQSQDRAGEAQALLAPVYARFTEGFETADLRAAREVLSRSTSSSGSG